jgi:hypothetical protein
MQIVTAQVVNLPAGTHTFLFESASAGTCAATVMDPDSRNSPAMTPIADSAFTKAASAVINYTVGGSVRLTFTLTGDGKLYLLNKN